MNSKLALVAFVVCQTHSVLSQQQGVNPSQPLVPGGWFRPLYSAAADAWRDYLIRAQQATNQFYQQWANITGMNNPMGGLGGFGGFGGLYGSVNQQQGSTAQTPRPLQGIFNPSNIPTGLDLSEILPGNQNQGRQDSVNKVPVQDSPPHTADTTPAQPPQVQPQVAPPVQQSPSAQQIPPVQQSPSVQQTPPVQQPAQAQPKPQPQVQQQSPQQLQQQPNTQTQGRPLQPLGQAANTVGMFGGANPIGWIG